MTHNSTAKLFKATLMQKEKHERNLKTTKTYTGMVGDLDINAS